MITGKQDCLFHLIKTLQEESPNDPLENLTLLRNVPTQMGNYMVTYLTDSAALEKNRTFYNLHFQKIDSATGKVNEDFELISRCVSDEG